MPHQANLCSMLVEMKHDIKVSRLDTHVDKNDLCDVMDSRIAQIIKQLISAPYCTNFSFEIDKPAEVDSFDRAALYQMEASDDTVGG
jgi:hypothetical protein